MGFGNQGNSGWQSQPQPPRGQWQGQPPQWQQSGPQGPPPRHQQGPGRQQPPGGSQWQGWRQPPPPKKGSSFRWVVTFITIFLALVLGAVFFALVVFVRLGEPEPTPSPSESESEAAKMYGPDDRPAYKELTDSLDHKIEKYTHLRENGEIYDMIEAEVDENYVKAFVFTLIDYRGALQFGAIGSSHNPLELDDRIHGWQMEVDALEEKFLKGEDLGVSWQITDGSGETKTYDGTPAHDPETTDETATVDDPYAFVTNYQFELDDQGTYVKAGEEIAAAFGMEVIYGVAELGDYCPNVLDYGDVTGLYCSATPDLIWIPSDVEHDHYPEYFSHPRYVDTIKHEMAHDLIMETCGTTSPPIAGERYEGLTNSYAMLHLGADFELLQPPSPDSLYWMSDESHEWARQVFAGNCG